jgi:hypothetical protein
MKKHLREVKDERKMDEDAEYNTPVGCTMSHLGVLVLVDNSH